MIKTIYFAISDWWSAFTEYASYEWHHLTPQKYLVLLIGTAIVGWLLMRSNMKT